MIHNMQMDNMLNDVVDIFTNVEGVKYVRLKGLVRRAQRLSNMAGIDEQTMKNVLEKMKNKKIIDWRYSYVCPHCHETFYQIEDVPSDQLKICDTCQNLFIPKDHPNSSIILL